MLYSSKPSTLRSLPLRHPPVEGIQLLPYNSPRACVSLFQYALVGGTDA
jgi:hypothetical protein